MKKLFVLFAAIAMVASCRNGSEELIERKLLTMTLEEKVGQMFLIRPEALDTGVCHTLTDLQERHIQAISDSMRAKAQKYPMGGVILFDHNIKDKYQLRQLTQQIHNLPGSPLIYIDEEGGKVLRIANKPQFNLLEQPSAASLAAPGRPNIVYESGLYVGNYLGELGIDVNLAPVADVNTNPLNEVIGSRAFSSDPRQAAPMVKSYLKGLQRTGVLGCIKHFPGHGDTTSDSNYGYAMTRKTWEEIEACELIPFRAGLKAGAQIVLVAHISLPNVLGSNTPATLSPVIMHDKLRVEMGFDGVIMTDSMDMGAITRQFSVPEACLSAVKAGADILLCVSDYPTVFNLIVSSVRNGEISEARIDESVRRILALKYR